MKKIILVLLLILTTVSLTGCLIYGYGKTYGYVDSVEEGWIWNKVYIKPSLMSGQEDCFIFKSDNTDVSQQFEILARTQQRAEFKYSRHFATMAQDCKYSNDEITSVTVLS